MLIARSRSKWGRVEGIRRCCEAERTRANTFEAYVAAEYVEDLRLSWLAVFWINTFLYTKQYGSHKMSGHSSPGISSMDSGIQAKVMEFNNAESEMHKDLHEIIIFKKQTPKERERERELKATRRFQSESKILLVRKHHADYII